MPQWYEELFRDYAERYEQESFTKGTVGEADFIEAELGRDTSKAILDIGCGTGRHAIELARRGYAVTGLDLSEAMLAKAKAKAEAAGVRVRFERRDARDFSFPEPFDAAVMLCEGAFPLMETDEMNFRILKNAHAALRPGGRFIFTTLNGLFPLFHSVKEFMDREATQGMSRENTFDLMTFRDRSVYETVDDRGRPMVLHCDERYYVPSEITWLLSSLGFRDVRILGGPQGAWSRDRALTTDDFEMLVTAEKAP
jgi:SAM-dependent methyltransferase